MKWIIEEDLIDKSVMQTAGVKARTDLQQILVSEEIQPLILKFSDNNRHKANVLKKILYHLKILRYWENLLKIVKTGDIVFIQFPVINHTLFLDSVIKKLIKKGVKTVVFIHDLEYLRLSKSRNLKFVQKWRLCKEELTILKLVTKLIVHNEQMYKFMNQELNIPKENMEVLEIFDYIIPSDIQDTPPKSPTEKYTSCIIAGNLNKDKAAYIYNLPKTPNFELYGPHYFGTKSENIHYHGSFTPEKLPFYLEGAFGLIWDGDSSETCTGVCGEYLKYNNPHKASLYLASGIPVAIWDKAALATFVKKYNVGIAIDSLYNLSEVMANISKEEYDAMVFNAQQIGKKIRDGFFTKQVLKKLY